MLNELFEWLFGGEGKKDDKGAISPKSLMPLYTGNYLIKLSENKSYTMKEKILSASKKIHTNFDIFLSIVI